MMIIVTYGEGTPGNPLLKRECKTVKQAVKFLRAQIRNYINQRFQPEPDKGLDADRLVLIMISAYSNFHVGGCTPEEFQKIHEGIYKGGKMPETFTLSGTDFVKVMSGKQDA